jgi:hypothetical protein
LCEGEEDDSATEEGASLTGVEAGKAKTEVELGDLFEQVVNLQKHEKGNKERRRCTRETARKIAMCAVKSQVAVAR